MSQINISHAIIVPSHYLNGIKIGILVDLTSLTDNFASLKVSNKELL